MSASPTSASAKRPTHLRAPYGDLVRNGVSAEDLKRLGDRAVDHALMRTAMSAAARQLSEQDWLYLVVSPESKLGQQARVAKGHRRTDINYWRYLAKVWERAVTQRHALTPRARSAYANEARQLVDEWDDKLSQLVIELDTTDALIIAALLDRIALVESPRVAFARRALQEVTGIPEGRLRTRMQELQSRGIIRLERRGKPAGPRSKSREANVYSVCRPAWLAEQLGLTEI